MFHSKPDIAYFLFPELFGKWGEINLNEIASDFADLLGPYGPPELNPFLDPHHCTKFKDFVAKVKGVDYLWGGYGEDRSFMWHGSYILEGQGFHRGVDFFVPQGSKVCLPTAAKLVHASYDPDQDIGWGGKLIFQWLHGYFIMGHLKNTVQEIGKTYRLQEFVGEVAEPELNGGTSPHLHLQCMVNYDENADGYGAALNLEMEFPNPLTQPW
jgi:hypothetical protein